MIPTALLAGLVLALLVPQRWGWLLGTAGAIGLALAAVIMVAVEPSVGVFFGALALGAVNAGIGVAIGAGIRRLASRGSRVHRDSAV